MATGVDGRALVLLHDYEELFAPRLVVACVAALGISVVVKGGARCLSVIVGYGGYFIDNTGLCGDKLTPLGLLLSPPVEELLPGGVLPCLFDGCLVWCHPGDSHFDCVVSLVIWSTALERTWPPSLAVCCVTFCYGVFLLWVISHSCSGLFCLLLFLCWWLPLS